jgi:hypothetical protein
MSWRLAEDPWITLGRYNAEAARGIVHTDEWRAEMAQLQQRFDEHQREQLIARGMSGRDEDIWMETELRPIGFLRALFRRSR